MLLGFRTGKPWEPAPLCEAVSPAKSGHYQDADIIASRPASPCVAREVYSYPRCLWLSLAPEEGVRGKAERKRGGTEQGGPTLAAGPELATPKHAALQVSLCSLCGLSPERGKVPDRRRVGSDGEETLR